MRNILILIATFGAACGVTEKVQTAKLLGAACKGTAVAAAAAYVPGSGEHPMIALRAGKRGYELAGRVLTMKTPAGGKIDETQLVLCVDEPKPRELEVCRFDKVTKVGFVPVPGTRVAGPEFPRTSITRSVRIVAAKTGETVAETELAGALPPQCDAKLIGGPSLEYFRGRDVGDLTIGKWAERFGREGLARAD